MKKKFAKCLCTLALMPLFIESAFSLDVDEKLTMRFLKVSQSKKTVLVNRGSEDGLVIGDHAKFFITQGVIARGVVVKASPSRTIWSVYRIVDPSEVVEGKVLNLKISTPVKLTEDPSKSLKDEGVEAGSDKIAIPMAEGADDLPKALSSEDKDELKDLGIEKNIEEAPRKTEIQSTKDVPVESYFGNASKNWEIFGGLFVSSLSGTQENEAEDSTETTSSTFDFSIGAEKYFATSSSDWLKSTSLIIFLRMRNNEVGSSAAYGFNNTEYGAGVNYHLFDSPFVGQKFIWLVSGTFGLGSATRTVKTAINNTVEETSIKGSSTFFSVGAGIKMNVNRNWGARFLLDYYVVGTSFEDDEGNTIEQSLSGPRANFGISYAF